MSSCGNPDSSEADALMPRRLKYGRSRDCVRCREKPGNIVIRHAVYCRDCFSPLVTLKFRKALQPSINASAGTSKRPRLKADGNLLMAFSGGLGSSLLLDIVHRIYFSNESVLNENEEPVGGKNHPRNADVWPSATVCYVEVCNAFPGMRDSTEELRTVVSQYPCFEYVATRIEDAFDRSWWLRVGGLPSFSQLSVDIGNPTSCDLSIISALFTPAERSPTDCLLAYLSSLPTQTAISTAIQTFIRILTLYTARSRGASHLLLGTSLTSLSISLISSISQGGGYTTREELQEEWTQSGIGSTEIAPTIRIVRPLRDVTMKECAAYARWNNITVVGKQRVPATTQGIHSLTKDFIVGLEKDYPSTVSTIARTCAKLAPKDAPKGSCLLCQRPMQHDIQEWKNRISIRSFGEAKLASDLHTPPNPHNNMPPPPLSSQSIDQTLSLTPHLCYSCHTTLTSRSSRGLKSTGSLPVPLPVWVSPPLLDSARVVNPDEDRGEVFQNRQPMRDAIAEYLLES
ncbi:hypothetical protein BJ138DRAFT_1155079 [Hygrophoropsis aurantiaca]|uniref:Uncharacterized protein n=1 Tax=Hygrophoropsis aurantiaca TaxID=72124 RepID=A0ACB8A9Y4_9AGAM|nr:hypothetical protein BJ138DRAFT_1155079 [Hygrophoropsis aurantiaca]